jgi:hypothetical protein
MSQSKKLLRLVVWAVAVISLKGVANAQEAVITKSYQPPIVIISTVPVASTGTIIYEALNRTPQNVQGTLSIRPGSSSGISLEGFRQQRGTLVTPLGAPSYVVTASVYAVGNSSGTFNPLGTDDIAPGSIFPAQCSLALQSIELSSRRNSLVLYISKEGPFKLRCNLSVGNFSIPVLN